MGILYVNVLSSGERVVVLGHGLGTDQSVWKYLVLYLVKDYRWMLVPLIHINLILKDTQLLKVLFMIYLPSRKLRVKSFVFVCHSYYAMVGFIAFVSRLDLFCKLIMLSATPKAKSSSMYACIFFLNLNKFKAYEFAFPCVLEKSITVKRKLKIHVVNN
ncbi:sigma factor sigb regulation protein rsbq, putative [Ricinus communis]|uniref:Sigma factor sigb regulation protein rsbq, putative n=1 Tax=Ricinus communis TaxID=3988 RepID=B9SG48_RICCO|nr:sigma factor sigb regulation protein rsbq, putative [Ricinus communis]